MALGAFPLHDPHRMNRRGYCLPCELRWNNERKPTPLLSENDVVREMIEQLLALADRLNKGKVPSYDY